MGGGRVVGLGHSVVFVCGVCDGQTGPTLGQTEDKFIVSNGTTGGRQTPTGRPTRGNVAPTTVFYLSFLFAVSGGGDFEFFFQSVAPARKR